MQRRRKQVFKHEDVIYLLLLPSLFGLTVFYVAPFFISIYYALIDNAVSAQFVGLDNLIETWNNQAFRLGVRNTVFFMGVSIPLIMLVALVLAMALRPIPTKVRRGLMFFFLLPLVIPSGSVVNFWRSLLSINGMLNRVLVNIGVFSYPYDMPIDWLNSEHAMWFIIFIFIWKNVGFNMILFQAGLDFIPKDYYEYASIEGAGRIRQFFIVTLTYLGPTFLIVFIMSVVNSFKVFREIYLLTGTHPNFSIYLLQHFLNNQFANMNYQLMASASFYIFGVILVLVFILYWLQQKQTYI